MSRLSTKQRKSRVRRTFKYRVKEKRYFNLLRQAYPYHSLSRIRAAVHLMMVTKVS